MKTIPKKYVFLLVIVIVLLAERSFGIGPYLDAEFTVIDQATGLEWQKSDDGKRHTWQQALAMCDSLNLGDNSDWRLPNVRELNSIVDHSKDFPEPALVWQGKDTMRIVKTNKKRTDVLSVSRVLDLSYWSATTRIDKVSSAWTVSFNTGFNRSHPKIGNNYVRCIRTRPLEDPVLFVNFEGTGKGTVSFDLTEDSCTTNCSRSLKAKSVVNSTAVADSKSEFIGWKEPCDGCRF